MKGIVFLLLFLTGIILAYLFYEKEKQLTMCEKEMMECDEQMVFSRQRHLISIFNLEISNIKLQTEQLIAKLRRYHELKERWPLLSLEKDEITQLEDDLGLDSGVVPDYDDSAEFTRQICEETSELLSSQVTKLEDALNEKNIEKMRKLQNYMELHISTFLEDQMKRIKKRYKSSKKLHQKGVLYRMLSIVYDHFMPFVANIAETVATNVFKTAISI